MRRESQRKALRKYFAGEKGREARRRYESTGKRYYGSRLRRLTISRAENLKRLEVLNGIEP